MACPPAGRAGGGRASAKAAPERVPPRTIFYFFNVFLFNFVNSIVFLDLGLGHLLYNKMKQVGL